MADSHTDTSNRIETARVQYDFWLRRVKLVSVMIFVLVAPAMVVLPYLSTTFTEYGWLRPYVCLYVTIGNLGWFLFVLNVMTKLQQLRQIIFSEDVE